MIRRSCNKGILSAIGRTPLIKLQKVIPDHRFHLYAKLEALNPGGSMKDRSALRMIEHGMETGAIRAGTVVIESSSGNMGVGLAQACSYYGLRFICVVDAKTTEQNISILRAYGAEIDLISKPHPATGEFLKARLDRVKELVARIGNCFWPNQYANLYNPLGYHQLMHEILSELGRVDYVFCATSTCGTMRGCAEYVKAKGLNTKIYAVDARGSVIFGGAPGARLISGHGAAVRPALYQAGLADRYLLVSDLDCVVGCRRLVRSEAILSGGSSGAVISAVDQVKSEIRSGAVCVAILPDRGERYLDTVYSDGWVAEHFGDVAHLYEA